MYRTIKYFLLLLPFAGQAQQDISLKNAIDTALKNNFDIQIARNNSTSSTISNTYGMAGGLPSLGASVSNNNSLSNIHQEYNTGTQLDKTGVLGNTTNGAITLGFPLFNGFKVIATKKQLEALQTQNQYQLNAQIQNTMAAVMLKYYDIVRQQSYLLVLQRSLDVAIQKQTIILNRKNAGMANDADYLQSQIDQTAIEQTIQSQKLVIEQAKIDLQQLMGRQLFSSIAVNDTIVVDSTVSYDSISLQLQKNQQYLAQSQQIRINEALAQQINAQRYPNLRINTSYNASYINNGAGTLVVNQSYGPQLGFSLQIPIYAGNQFKTQHKVALYNLENAKLQTQSLLASLTAGANKTYQSYIGLQQQIAEQKKTYILSKRLLDLVMKRFSLNMATIIDLKTAQASFEASGYLLTNLSYAAKSSEIELKRLIYDLK